MEEGAKPDEVRSSYLSLSIDRPRDSRCCDTAQATRCTDAVQLDGLDDAGSVARYAESENATSEKVMKPSQPIDCEGGRQPRHIASTAYGTGITNKT